MNPHEPEWLSIVREKVETLRYGAVQIVIHDSKVTLSSARRKPASIKFKPTRHSGRSR